MRTELAKTTKDAKSAQRYVTRWLCVAYVRRPVDPQLNYTLDEVVLLHTIHDVLSAH